MNFVQQLEESLRDLAAEARKKHPGVKEASERATLKLRQLKNNYVAAVRKANAANDKQQQHPTTALFQSSELLHPFLLAANYPNASAKLRDTTFRALRLLLEADALVPSDALHLIRVWMIQAHVVLAFYQKHYPTGTRARSGSASKNDLDASQRSLTSLDTTNLGSTNNPESQGSSSWFGWASSSTSKTDKGGSGHSATSALKNAVISSSTGQTGQSYASQKEMEKLALDLLSCLLQLLQGLRKYPEHLTTEVWTNAVALACLWLAGPLPPRHTVRQAAHSTLSQLMSLLYSSTGAEGDQRETALSGASIGLLRDTWNDLLILAQPMEADTADVSNEAPSLKGAFAQCRRQIQGKAVSRAPVPEPPSSNFALELMTRLWRDHHPSCRQPPTDEKEETSEDLVWKEVFAESTQDNQEVTNEIIAETIACTEMWLHEIAVPSCTVERTHRVVQWTVLVLQTQSSAYPILCRRLIAPLTKPVALATEACRTRYEFEDGFTYTQEKETEDRDSLLSTKGEGKQGQGSQSSLASNESYFPPALLWKAGIVLEAIYRLLDKDFDVYVPMLSDRSAMGALTETLSDFATIGASCQEHMRQLVNFCNAAQAQQHSLQPKIARRTEQSIAAGSIEEGHADGKSSSLSYGSLPSNILGESLWIAMFGIVRLTQSLPASNNVVDLVEESFAACLAVLQHFLKRFPGSSNLVEISLSGYVNLSDACLSSPGSAMQRKALLSSLCKLSLPSWGKHDPSSQLENHHIPCLLTLLRIVHKHFEDISSEWDLILWTFEELSVMPIASSKLSEKAYHGALAVTAIFSRFGPFSTCFSVDCLMKFVDALSQIVQVLMEDRDLLGDSIMVPHEKATSESIKASAPKDPSLGRQIMNIGVRAIYGGQSSVAADSVSELPTKNERAKGSFYEEYRQNFAKRIAESKSTVRVGAIGRLPFSLSLLIDVAMANSFRYAKCGERISGKLSDLAAASPPVRPFLMDIIAMLTMSHISDGGPSPAPSVGPAKLAITDPMQSQLLAVESVWQSETPKTKSTSKSVAQTDLLGPLCETIRTTEKAEVAEAALGTINAVLETAGHNLSGEVWTVVIAAIASLSGDPTYQVDRSGSDWATCCLNGFKCLKLIASDFQDQLHAEAGAQSALLSCCFAFGSSRHDVNTSLTAIGLLWTIADQDSDSASSSIQQAISKLVQLSQDTRAEVRNAAINTLFSCIVGRGTTFSNEQWQLFFVDAVFVVYKAVEQAMNSDQSPSSGNVATPSNRYKLSRHHSQDSEVKQWLGSQVIVLRGLLRVLKNFFPLLLSTSVPSERGGKDDNIPWFQDCWVQILDFAYEASACVGDRDTLDIRTVGVELLAIACQISSKAGISAAAAPARVGTHMEVVNGALRIVRESKQIVEDTTVLDRTEAEDALRDLLFLESFESLESYVELVQTFVDKGKAINDAQLQVLHKFCAGLSQVYECCKKEELANCQDVKAILFLESLLSNKPVPEKADDLERRFVKMIVSTIRLSTVNPSARYLNQSQRAGLELLNSMAMNSSVEAFQALLRISGDANFAGEDSDTEESGSKSVSVIDTKLISTEASTTLCQAISNGENCHACALYVFHMITRLFQSPTFEPAGVNNIIDARKRPVYHRVLPIFVTGFEALKSIAINTGSKKAARLKNAADQVLLEFCNVLKKLLTPMSTPDNLQRIRRPSDLGEIVKAMGEYLPKQHSELVCSVLSPAATSIAKVAVLHEGSDTANDVNDILPKSRKHRNELLALFRCCFVTACTLGPDYPELHPPALYALGICMAALEEGAAETNIRVQFGLAVCEEMCRFGDSLPNLLTNVFPLLCKLLIFDNETLRKSVVQVLESCCAADLLEAHKTRADNVEREAGAEKLKLQRRIVELEKQNVKLRHDLTILEASSGLETLLS